MIMFACTVSCNYFIHVLFSQIYDLFLYNFLSLAFDFILHDVFLLLYFNFRYIDFLNMRVLVIWSTYYYVIRITNKNTTKWS